MTEENMCGVCRKRQRALGSLTCEECDPATTWQKRVDAAPEGVDVHVWEAEQKRFIVLCLCDNCQFPASIKELTIGGHRKPCCDRCGLTFDPLEQAHHYSVDANLKNQKEFHFEVKT